MKLNNQKWMADMRPTLRKSWRLHASTLSFEYQDFEQEAWLVVSKLAQDSSNGLMSRALTNHFHDLADVAKRKSGQTGSASIDCYDDVLTTNFMLDLTSPEMQVLRSRVTGRITRKELLSSGQFTSYGYEKALASLGVKIEDEFHA